ncbi:MAG: hypothetical protein HKN22_02030, partial [Bacteroidia bacterium]|nr:hypothetical protein [Bacteroidia bacterium]
SLSMRGNLLQSLPKSIGLLTDLKVLDLKGNELKEIPMTITSLSKLKYLNLAFNPDLDFAIVLASLGKLKNLEKLDLSYNNVDPHIIDKFKESSNCKIVKQELTPSK